MQGELDTPSTSVFAPRRTSQTDRKIDKFLNAACDSSRRSILEMLIPPNGQDSPNGYELRAGEIARRLGLSPSTTSEHLRHLHHLHLVDAHKEGTIIYYRLCNYHLVRAFHELLLALETHYQSSDIPL